MSCRQHQGIEQLVFIVTAVGKANHLKYEFRRSCHYHIRIIFNRVIDNLFKPANDFIYNITIVLITRDGENLSQLEIRASGIEIDTYCILAGCQLFSQNIAIFCFIKNGMELSKGVKGIFISNIFEFMHAIFLLYFLLFKIIIIDFLVDGITILIGQNTVVSLIE